MDSISVWHWFIVLLTVALIIFIISLVINLVIKINNNNKDNISNIDIKGIGGWLIVFLVILAIGFILNLVFYQQASQLIELIPDKGSLLYIESYRAKTISFVALIISAFIFLLIIFSRHKLVPQIVVNLIFLLCIIFPAVVLAIAPMYGDIPSSISSFILGSIWMIYFLRSKRVENTYCENSLTIFNKKRRDNSTTPETIKPSLSHIPANTTDTLKKESSPIDKSVTSTRNMTNLEEWTSVDFGEDAKSNIRFMANIGDSMSPTIADGDTLFVDITKQHFVADGIYVIDLNGCLLTRRLKAMIDGRLAVISDNKDKYETEYIDQADIKNLVIVGLVKKWGALKG